MMYDSILLTHFKPTIACIDSTTVFDRTFRLDSQYYALFENKIGKLKADYFLPLEKCCLEIFEVPPFKHIYVKKGIPFYTSSDLFNNDLVPSHFLTPEMPNIESYMIKKDQILMARSGNVESGILGQILIVGDILDGTTTSDHVLRFTVNNEVIETGYLAAFLMSEFCKGQLLKNAAGAVIPAIRPDALRDLQIPIPSASIQTMIGDMLNKAVESKDKAINILNQGRSLVLQYNNLPPIGQTKTETLDPKKEVEIRLVNAAEFTHDYRLDSHYYSEAFINANESIRSCSIEYRTLQELTHSIFMGNRFTRNFVNSDNGIPFIGTKNTMQLRPTELKFLSKSETSKIDELILEKSWILLARSGSLGGTFGKVSFVWNNFEGYCGSEHIIRVCANESEIDPAYLYAFLSSQYGYSLIIQLRHGALIDEIDPSDLGFILVPIPSKTHQKEIGELVRQAYSLRAEAILLEDEAQKILTEALTNA